MITLYTSALLFFVSACCLDSTWHWGLIFTICVLSGIAFFTTLIVGINNNTFNKGGNYEDEKHTDISENRQGTDRYSAFSRQPEQGVPDGTHSCQ